MSPEHINDYVDRLLTDRNFQKSEYRQYKQNGYEIHNVVGDISSEILRKAIVEAKHNRRIRDMLCSILWHTDSSSMTYLNFDLICKFPKRKRRLYLSALVHSKLAFYQLVEIYRECKEYESFAWLLDKMCCSELFNEQDILNLLNKSQDQTAYAIQSGIDCAREQFGESQKLNTAQKWLIEHSSEMDDGALW